MADTPPPPPGYEPVAASSATPPPPPGYETIATPGLMESFGRGAVEGATFGFDDKLGMDKDRREASRKANPWTHFMGELAGGVAPIAASYLLPNPATTPAAAARSVQLASKARALLTPGEIGTIGQSAAQGAKLGSVYGGLSGAGHADVQDVDTFGDALTKRAMGAGKGAAIGAALGPIVGAVGHGLYRGAQALGGMRATAAAETDGLGSGALTTAVKRLERDRITPDELITQIRAEFPDDSATAGIGRRFWGGIGNKQPIMADHVEETVRRAMAGESALEISAALRAANGGRGPGESSVQSLLDELAHRHLGPLNIVDRASMVRTGSGDNTQTTMRAAAATPGEHLGIARESLLERQVGAQGRMGQLFDRMIGSSDYEGVTAKHTSDLENAGARAYGTAFANEAPFDLNPIFNKWEAKFGNMRGPIPDAIMGQLNAMRSVQPVLDQAGQVAKPNPNLVNRAPPMDLEGFIMARQGLFDAIQSAKGEKPNLAKNLTGLYNDLTAEVGRTNPKWLEANQIWRDGKVAEEALDAGARMTTRLNASSRENLSHLTDAQDMAKKAAKELRDANKALKKASQGSPQETAATSAVESAQARIDAANSRSELFKVGLVRALSDMLANQGETHNLTKQLLLPGAQKMLRQALGKDADQFFKAVRAEQAMHRTYQSQFGSQTTPLREAVDELNWAPSFEASWHNLGIGKVLQLAQEYAARNINAARNKQLMGLYTETDPMKQLDTLRAMQSLHAARSDAGNAVGRPVVSSAGPGLDALMGAQSDPYPKRMTPYRP